MSFVNELIKDEKGTVGSMTYDDLDSDGFLEFLVPNYDKGYVEVYQFYEENEEFL